MQWDAEFSNEIPGELIALQSLPDADVQNAGSVRFEPFDGGAATRVKVECLPPGGTAGALRASIWHGTRAATRGGSSSL